ncbi:8003_t:CDS:2 [Gigaspora rosea]|nr:8003_t:CDS:2 [Gigaspora rosea]
MEEYFKCQHPSSYSFLNYLRYNINDHQQWNKRTAMFTRYCIGLKLCSEDPDISDELKQQKDSEVVKSLWAGIFSNAGGLDFYYLMKKIDNELEINRINLQGPSSSNSTSSSSPISSRKRKALSNSTSSSTTISSRKRKALDDDNEIKGNFLDQYKSLLNTSKNLWILKDQTRVIKKIIDFFENNIDYVDKLTFNHPLLSGVIDLDIIDEVMLKIFSFDELKEMMHCDKIFSWKVIDENMKKWVDDFVNTEKPQNIPIPDSLDHEECTYILDMYLQLKKIWESKLFDNRQQGDGGILEDTYVHEIMHNIMYYTVRDLSPSSVRIAWGTRTPEEINGRVERTYDEMFFMSKNVKKFYQDKFQSKNKPNWLGTFKIDDHKYELIYGEAAGPPFLSASFKSEGDRRKVIRFLLRCIKSMDKTLKEHFSSPVDGDLIESAKCIPRFGMLLYGTFLKIIYYDNSYEIGRIIPLVNIKLPLQSNSNQFSTTNYLYGLIIFRRAVKEALEGFNNLRDCISNRMNVFNHSAM